MTQVQNTIYSKDFEWHFQRVKQHTEELRGALRKRQWSQLLLNFKSFWGENIFLANTGTVPPINWSATFHVLKGNILQLTFYVHSCPFIWEKENAFWHITQARLPTQHNNNSHRSELRPGSPQNKGPVFLTRKGAGAGREAAFWHNRVNKSWKE